MIKFFKKLLALILGENMAYFTPVKTKKPKKTTKTSKKSPKKTKKK